ncbi:MAG: hypothetical protein GYA18_07855 [Chloroflexi bacterium]|nr:hypothetical protein [Chloroflexota bacterium]
MYRQMLLWYLWMLLLGLVNYPISALLFSKLRTKGYAFSKILGLLLWGYLYWITNTLGLLPNTTIGAISALLLVILINGVILIRKRALIRQALAENKCFMVGVELLFLAAFVIAALLRAMSPNLTGTEKPMELAFINAILRSPQFPPSDPWLSDYSISYYYFGYLMVALLASVSGVAGSVAFNLGIAAWVGLICVAAYGLLYELLQVYSAHRHKNPHYLKKSILFLALLAPFFILVVSNAEGGLEILHASGAFWSTDARGEPQSTFWKWLDIQELNQPPSGTSRWTPQRSGGTWWWRASRVISDYDAAGNFREVIDEFPAFTFFLADLHPHVLSMPFFLLCIGVGLNLFLGDSDWLYKTNSWRDFIKQGKLWSTASILGGMLFMNTWDFPASIGIFALVFLLQSIHSHSWSWQIVWAVIWKMVLMVMVCVLIYLPFFLGFASQAGGILPSLIYRTRGIHFLIMFLPFLLILLIYLCWSNRQQKAADGKIIWYVLWFALTLGLLNLFFPLSKQLSISIWTGLQNWIGGVQARLSTAVQSAYAFVGIYGADDIASLVTETFFRRLQDSSVVILLLVMLYLVVRYLFRKTCAVELTDDRNVPIHTFVQFLILLGIGLCLFPEFFFLVDVFQNRMNTIFKFYFQAWMVWSIAGSFALIVLWNSLRGLKGFVFRIVSIFTIAICCIYPFYVYHDRITYTDPRDWTLDGSVYLDLSNAGDAAVIDKLVALPYGVIAEAVGGSYSGYARIATNTGYPNVLGWPGHEMQWRGGAKEMGSRQVDLQTLYETSDWFAAKKILDQYGVQYIVIGNMERSVYAVEEIKFNENLTLILQQNGTTLYGYP